MNRAGLVVLVVVVVVLAAGGNLWIALTANSTTEERLARVVREEQVARVHTIGERCESQLHSAEEHGPQEAWFLAAHARCLQSLAKVETRAHIHYLSPR